MATWTWKSAVEEQLGSEALLGGEDDTGADIRTGKDAQMFVVDCSPAMFRSNQQGDVPFEEALKTVLATFKTKAMRGSADLLAVLFYGTEATRNPWNHEHMVLYFDLDLPDAETIQELQSFCDDSSLFLKQYGSTSEGLKMANVLWACSTMFCTPKRAKTLATRHIVLFTNDANPHESDVNLKNAANTRIKDLLDSGVHLDVFGMDRGEVPFDYDVYYRERLPVDEEESSSISFRSFRESTQLQQALRKKESSKRTQARMLWKLCDNMYLAVKLYSLVMEAKRPRSKLMSEMENAMVQADTKFGYAKAKVVGRGSSSMGVGGGEGNNEDGEENGAVELEHVTVTPDQYEFAYQYGPDLIRFTQEEIKEMKALGEPGLSLMGFKPRQTLKHHYNMNHSYFLFPDDSIMKGSTTCFTALLRKMHDLDTIAICRMQARKGAALKMVALLPQLETVDENGLQEKPAGFNVILLPFADDIRKVGSTATPMANQDLVASMKHLIQELQIPRYRPENYFNPILQKHYQLVEAIALGYPDLPEMPETDMLPGPTKRVKRLEGELAGFMEEVGKLARDQPAVAPSASSRPAAAKRSRSEKTADGDEEEDSVEDMVQRAFQKGNLQKLTVAVLKEFLKAKGEKAVGKKADLVEQVEDWMQKQK